jgi:hypothetical protein
MGLLANIGTWFSHFFKTLKQNLETFGQHAWTLLEPFITAFFSEAEKEIIASLQSLALTAVSQIATQGLPDSNAKRAAFSATMQAAAQAQGKTLTSQMENWLRENALAMYNAYSAPTPPTGQV